MFKPEFFGLKPILHEESIYYRKVSNTNGIYIFNKDEVNLKIETIKNEPPLVDQCVREIFWICDKGRRPWVLEAEKSFLSLVSLGCNLLDYLRGTTGVSTETYAFINPLDVVLRLEYEIQHIQSLTDITRWVEILNIFYQLIHKYIYVYDLWTLDLPQIAQLPPTNGILFLLETGDDNNFIQLLTAFARTKSEIIHGVLLDFLRDDEPEVRSIAAGLIKKYFN